MKRDKQNGFTLVEVLVSLVIAGFMIAAVGFSTSVLFQMNESARQRSKALYLLQLTQEDLRRVASDATHFAHLETCPLPEADDQDNSNPCGFMDVAEDFPEHQRWITVSREGGSLDYKRVHIQVQWMTEQGMSDMHSLLFLARPPAPLPGNLTGQVVSRDDPGEPLQGVKVTIAHVDEEFQSATETSDTFETSLYSMGTHNYTFLEPRFLQFILPVGVYRITAGKPGFEDYPGDGVVQEVRVLNQSETVVPQIVLNPLPEDATLNVRVVDQSQAGDPLVPFFKDGTEINLFRDGGSYTPERNSPTAAFSISFEDTEEQCFTVNTTDAYKAGWVGFPACGFSYGIEGYSTAQHPSDELDCAHAYDGGSDSDHICLSPGEDKTVLLKVTPVPTATITGRVVIAGTTEPIAGAVIRAWWPQNSEAGSAPRWRIHGVTQTAVTDEMGFFTFTVPAVQDMFPDSDIRNFLQVQAAGEVTFQSCCEESVTTTRYSSLRRFGGLTAGAVVDFGVFEIANSDIACGDVNGYIWNDFTGQVLPAASIRIATSTNTNGAGYYAIACSEEQNGFRLPVNPYRVQSSKSEFYAFDSYGNDQYARQSHANIPPDDTLSYDVRLWPVRYGEVHVTVKELGTGSPLKDIPVRIKPYTGGAWNLKTDVNGEVIFNRVIETWPPEGLPSGNYYKSKEQHHDLEVEPDSDLYEFHTQDITDLSAGEVRTISVFLRKIGGI